MFHHTGAKYSELDGMLRRIGALTPQDDPLIFAQC